MENQIWSFLLALDLKIDATYPYEHKSNLTFEQEELGKKSSLQVDRSRSRGGSCHGGGEQEGEEHTGEVQQDSLNRN